MTATIFIEQDGDTCSGTLHRYNGYNAGFSAPRSEPVHAGSALKPNRGSARRAYTRNGW